MNTITATKSSVIIEREKEKSVFALKEYENDNFNLQYWKKGWEEFHPFFTRF